MKIQVTNMIYEIRGQRVMLDFDLAALASLNIQAESIRLRSQIASLEAES